MLPFNLISFDLDVTVCDMKSILSHRKGQRCSALVSHCNNNEGIQSYDYQAVQICTVLHCSEESIGIMGVAHETASYEKLSKTLMSIDPTK